MALIRHQTFNNLVNTTALITSGPADYRCCWAELTANAGGTKTAVFSLLLAKHGVMQLELTVVSREEQGQEAGPSTQEQSQHGDWTASHAKQRDQEAGRLRKAREELSREHVHTEGADVHADPKIRQSHCCTTEKKRRSQEIID